MTDPVKSIGRPTTYRPEYCDTVRDMMGQGLSKTAVAGFLKVSRQRLIDWATANPEFQDAVKEGEAMRTLKLEQDLLSAETGPQVTSRIFALKNAAPDEWKDKQAVDHTSSDGSMTPVQGFDIRIASAPAGDTDPAAS